MKYQPELETRYRETYRENLLYLARYAEMKFDDLEQKAWTLALNRFLVEDLHLHEQAVVDFVAAESVLIRELFRAREEILPQYLEAGLTRLEEIEKQERPRLLKILGTPENYRKLRELERSQYEQYIARPTN